jgi:hypothetical protein
VHDIFSGKIVNWKEVGGADTPIRVVSREEGSGTRRSFDSLVLHADKLTPTALFQNSNGTIREVASPIKTAGAVTRPAPAPRLGEHTEDLLRGLLAYPEDRIAALRASGALGAPAGRVPHHAEEAH